MPKPNSASLDERICLERNFAAAGGRFRTGVSLHSHTLHSRESVVFLERLARKIAPLRVAAGAIERRYRARHGQTPDLNRLFWTPPLAAHQAWQLEHDHLQQRFGLRPLVSLTDHDNIDAPLTLRVLDACRDLPVSVEWTVPFGSTFFHLGVHNLAADRARAMMCEFECFTASPNQDVFASLLETVADDRAALIVFNHPCWDENLIGAGLYRQRVLDFLGTYRAWIHAIELNGFRPWRENQAAIALARSCGKPIISGGDRHGLEPSTILNLTNAGSFNEFAAEIRSGWSQLLFTEQYFTPMASRVLQSVQDILGDLENHGSGWVRWSDRVFYVCDDGETRPVSRLWPVEPWPLRAFERALRGLRHPGLRLALRALARSDAPL